MQLSDQLRERFVEVYPSYIRTQVDGLALAIPDDWEEAIAKGTIWLENALADLLERPFGEQDRGPLELFQEALRFPTYALEQAGNQPVSRDETTRNALPGDLFGLAPASSRDLGEEAWMAHLSWGAAKAAAIKRDR
ncbi:MAG: hypothetical protein F4Z36_02490 [Acidimicrobiia bacterium]|nr:hypothetical protein [bacterium]MDE0644002.1 hypothetical protein [bacterium]MXX63932.1 hypothetical protein [Acidimicrobiia bacterium]MYD04530.1 hypothetical protein [Acidimicrobiia bacterium]